MTGTIVLCTLILVFFCVRCDDRAKSSGRWLLLSPLSAVVMQIAPRAWCPLQCLLAKTVGVLSPGVGRSDTSLIDLDFNSRSQECEKANTSAPIISQSYQSILMEFDKGNLVYYWDLLVWLNPYSFYLVHSIFDWDSPTYMILLKKKKKQKNKNKNKNQQNTHTHPHPPPTPPPHTQLWRWLVFKHLQADFFQTWYDDKDY